MYASIRRYKTDPKEDLTQLVNEEFVPLISTTPGFIAYYGIKAGDGVWASISGEVIVLDVEGMRCPDCPLNIATSLMVVPGVTRVMVDFDARVARLIIDPPNSISPEMLIAAIERSGFSATLRGEN